MRIAIDPHAGFCYGVENAIKTAESILDSGEKLACLGEIVHNQKEMKRLAERGMTVVNKPKLTRGKGNKLLIRAHGEPPQTYKNAKQNNLEIVDATCPIVLKLQAKIKKAWREIEKHNGTLVIAGKKNHPEVIGLTGQTNHHAVVVENVEEIKHIDIKTPVRLFAQTTIDITKYLEIIRYVETKFGIKGNSSKDFIYYNSICGQVANRIPGIKKFCQKFEVIVFVSGKNSSNGKTLFSHCRNVNPQSYFISSPDELKAEWFKTAQSAGISGATSTPKWLMKEVESKIKSFT